MRVKGLASMISRRARPEMPPIYLIEPIGPETIESAYRLANAVIPTLSKYEWLQSCHCSSVARSPLRSKTGEGGDRRRAKHPRGTSKDSACMPSEIMRPMVVSSTFPFFIALSAADGEGVAQELLNFLMSKCDRSVCSGIRIWEMSCENWEHRHSSTYIDRSDYGLFLPALASTGEVMKPLRAHVLSVAQTIDRLSR